MADSNVKMLHFFNHIQALEHVSARGQFWSHSPMYLGPGGLHGARLTGCCPSGWQGQKGQDPNQSTGHTATGSTTRSDTILIHDNRGYSELPLMLDFQHSTLQTFQEKTLYSSHFSSTGSFVQI